MMLQEQQKMMLISLKSVEYEEAKSLVGNLQGVKENQQECLNLLKDVADEKSENWSTIH